MLTRTRKRVIRSAILPGITSGGTTKLIQDTTTNKPAQNNCNGDVNVMKYVTEKSKTRNCPDVKNMKYRKGFDLTANSRLSSSEIYGASESSQIQQHYNVIK